MSIKVNTVTQLYPGHDIFILKNNKLKYGMQIALFTNKGATIAFRNITLI